MNDDFVLTHTASPSDLDTMHGYLSTQTYWAKGVPRDVVERSVQNSLPFLWHDATGMLVAFARVVTDKATFAYLTDVFVVPEYRGQGMGKRIVEQVLAHPDLQNLRRFLLFTLDAHGLYAQYGFEPVRYTDRVMERFVPDVYRHGEASDITNKGLTQDV